MPPILHYSHPHSDRQLPCAAFALPGDPLAAGRVIHFHDPLQGYAAGSSVSVGANLLIERFPWVELGVVEAGELRLQGDGFDLQLNAGDCFVVPRGIDVRWHHRGQLRRLFMAFPGLEACSDMPKVPIRLDLSQPLSEASPPAASVLLTPTPNAWSETLFSVANLRIGLWQCEPYARKQVEPAYSELMFILEGAVTLAAGQGKTHVVRAGETVVVPKGATNAWTSEDTVRKVFCILG
ncbi:cupin domain-containing protein [Pseudomonas abietaniphila]|uniref:Predicted enzyme of the cupin superfamily n=1 Tax=Pseudomonas abietaniphila TaxID=89065 RepID=A0A1G8AJF2_9PSED|nr:cupin domain-containing protein [Pseudomonas abietaniphila]SDH20963.1 Predicted enzyme of the cupin superfamily [Pseudomonas abietaniphila]